MSTETEPRTHYRTCTLCEAMCGVAIRVEGERITSIRGDEADVFSHGYICPKAAALQDLHEDPDRLRHPVRRGPNGFERIGWDEAFDEVASRLKAVQAEHGKNAVGLYLGNPSVHNHGSILYGIPFAQALGTRNRFSATSVDQLPHQLAALAMFGHQLLVPVPDLDRCDFLLILGANPLVSNGSLMTAAGVGKRLRAIRARVGGRVVVVDPRRTETAEVADEHHFIQPGTDALLLLALVHTLFAEGLAAPGRLAAFTDGLDVLEREARDFSPERVAAPTGLDAGTIRRLARALAESKAGAVYGRMGACTQELGGLTAWLVNALNVLTGNLDRPGGVMFTRPAVDVVEVAGRIGQRGHFDKGRSRVRGLPEFGGEYPAVTMADEMLTEGEGRIRAMVTVAGNPVLSTPNGRRLDQALAGLDFMVSVDLYVNETTRHANLILPPTGHLEHDHYDLAFHVFAVRNTAKYSPALFEPAKDTRHDWEIFVALLTRLGERGVAGPWVSRAKRAALGHLSPARLVDLGLRLGPYGKARNPLGRGLSLRSLEREVHGVDLGALKACLPERLYTKDRRIALAPALFVKDLDRARRRLGGETATPTPADAGFDLRLIGRRHLRSNNSWMHNSHRLVKGPERCTLLIHPEDAARRGLATKQRARVASRVGSIELEVEVTDEMMRGVVSIPHGWGHDRPGVELGVARKHAGASVNDLTDELALDTLSGTAALSGVPVRVEAATS